MSKPKYETCRYAMSSGQTAVYVSPNCPEALMIKGTLVTTKSRCEKCHHWRGSDMLETGVCPMLDTDAIEKYKLSDRFVKNFCDKGCCPDCGKFLYQELVKKGVIKDE